MKFKKSISFVLTLCMVLSLFATFVIPASAEATNLAAGKTYTITDQFRAGGKEVGWGYDPNAPISYPDDGVKLTDGTTAPADNSLYDAAWAGFNHNTPSYKEQEYPSHKITVDLGAVCDIDSASIYLATCQVGNGAGIDYKYSFVSVKVSEDGETWTDAGYVEIGDTVVTDKLVAKIDIEADVSAQYVQFRLTRGGWLFVSEVEVYGTEAAPEAGLAGENVSRWEAGAEFAVLTDGDNGVGEVNNYNPFQPRLFGVASGVMEATDYTLTFVIDKAEFNTITLYALDFANGGVMLPEAVTFVVDGVKYEAAINANANGIATIVATLDEAVTANCVVAEVTMGASPYSFTIFNMFTEFEVSLEEAVVEPGIEIVLPEGTGITIPDGYGATDILLDGYTGVGEITAHDGNHDKLVCLRNGTTDVESEYSLKVTLDKETAFNVVTLYILSHTGGNVGLPKAVTVNINGVDYEAAIAGEDASVVAIEVKLEEAVSATGFTVDVVMNSGSVKYNMFSEVAVSLVEEDDESFKETHTHVDGVNVGTIQQLGADWEGKPSSCFWYLVDSAKDTVTVSVVVDDRKVVEGDTQLRIWIETDKVYTARTTLVDVKVNGGKAEVVRCDNNLGAAVKSATYKVVGNDYYFEVVLDKATLGITGEYGLNITLSQTGSTTMHSIKYDNVTGEGATYAPWTTTEFYEIFDKAPTTSQVVENFNHADWNTGVNTFHAAYIFTDAEMYKGVGMAWWYHAAFAPVANGAYVVTEVAAPGSDAATKNTLTIPEGGFIWVAWTSAEAGNGKDSGAYAKGVMSGLKVGDLVLFNGLDIANLTTAEDASATVLAPAADMDLLVSHNYNYSWHCFETQIISGLVPDAPKTAGDAPFLKDSVLDADILYIVENVNGAYLVTGIVSGKAIPDTAIPEGGFLYYVTANCTGYDKICHGELIGKYLTLGEIDLATTFAIDTQQGNPAKVMQAVSGFKTGDADLDGKITATDYAIIRKLVLGTLTAEDVGELVLKTADVNGNGKVDARDYYLAKRAFLGTYVIPGWEAEDAE